MTEGPTAGGVGLGYKGEQEKLRPGPWHLEVGAEDKEEREIWNGCVAGWAGAGLHLVWPAGSSESLGCWGWGCCHSSG